MYRTLKVPFKASTNTIQKLFEIRRICGLIWNYCVQITRYYYHLGGKWITKTQLQAELKGLYPIHSQTIQAVAHKFLTQEKEQEKQDKKDSNK